MKRVCIVACSLLALAMLFGSVHASVGLGISHYNPHVTLLLGEKRWLAVAQVNSVGDEPLIVDGLWRQTNGTLKLPIHLCNSTLTLEPSGAAEIFILIDVPENASFTGEYEGEVDLGGRYVNFTGNGSPVVPGGTANVWITVNNTVANTTGDSSNDFLLKLGVALGLASAAAVSVGAMVVYRKHGKNEEA